MIYSEQSLLCKNVKIDQSSFKGISLVTSEFSWLNYREYNKLDIKQFIRYIITYLSSVNTLSAMNVPNWNPVFSTYFYHQGIIILRCWRISWCIATFSYIKYFRKSESLTQRIWRKNSVGCICRNEKKNEIK